MHRHPAFFGRVEDVVNDCCGYCPVPVTQDELDIAEEESKIYVSGAVSFIKDDPGRQVSLILSRGALRDVKADTGEANWLVQSTHGE